MFHSTLICSCTCSCPSFLHNRAAILLMIFRLASIAVWRCCWAVAMVPRPTSGAWLAWWAPPILSIHSMLALFPFLSTVSGVEEHWQRRGEWEVIQAVYVSTLRSLPGVMILELLFLRPLNWQLVIIFSSLTQGMATLEMKVWPRLLPHFTAIRMIYHSHMHRPHSTHHWASGAHPSTHCSLRTILSGDLQQTWRAETHPAPQTMVGAQEQLS